MAIGRSHPPEQGQREPPAILPPSLPPDGPAFILITREDGSFKRTSPFAIKRGLDATCGPLNGAKTLRSGSILVEAKDGPQANRLLAVQTFLGTKVTVQIAERLNSVEGSIREDSLSELTNAEILAELQDQGVCRVERLRSRNIEELGPNPTVRLSFKGAVLPQAVYCGYVRVPVHPWVPAPPQCGKCWAVGTHQTRACRRREQRCGRCAGAHPSEGCREVPRCCGCGQAHPAWDRMCPIKQDAREWHQAKQRQAREAHWAQAQAPARPLIPGEGDERDREWPPLPPGRQSPPTRPEPKTPGKSATRDSDANPVCSPEVGDDVDGHPSGVGFDSSASASDTIASREQDSGAEATGAAISSAPDSEGEVDAPDVVSDASADDVSRAQENADHSYASQPSPRQARRLRRPLTRKYKLKH